jgi:hypothetical protein
MAESIAKSLGLELFSMPSCQVRLADGSTVTAVSNVIAHVQCGAYADNLTFCVVPGEVGVIFGYEWLVKMDPVIEWK